MEHQNQNALIHTSRNSELNSAIKNLLSKDSIQQLKNLDLTPVDAVNSNLPIFNSLNQDESTMARGCTLELIMTYIEIYYPGTNVQAVAIEFVSLVFHERKDWNIIDVQAFINHIKKTAYRPLTVGHKINPTELIDCISSYENLKLDHNESMYHNFKIKEKEMLFEGEPAEGFKKLVRHFEEKGAKKARERELEREVYYQNKK